MQLQFPRLIILAAFLGITLTSCKISTPPEVQHVLYDGNKRKMELWVFPENPNLDRKFKNGPAAATYSAEGFVTLQIQAVSFHAPLCYRWDWQGSDGKQATDPTAEAWRRMEQDSAHPTVLSGTSTIRNPSRAILRIREDYQSN